MAGQGPEIRTSFTTSQVGHVVGRAAGWLMACRWRMALAVGLASLAIMLPGVVRLPAVDRTEIVYATTARDMVERGDWLDPRYRGDVHAFRPIGTYWAQGASAALARDVAGVATDPRLAANITPYRVPGMFAVAVAAAAIVVLAAPVVGVGVAALAAGLFAVAPLTVLVGQLAIAEGLSLLFATVAMLALLRIYLAPAEQPTGRLALAFWISVGFGVLINALMVPFLVLSTIVALWIFDSDVRWLKRLHASVGLLLAAAIAAPWIIVRAHQDGVAFSSLTWREFFEAMTGSQDMKLRAFPGTFVLAAVIGFLPGAAMLAPAGLRLWRQRANEPLARFLLAWTLGALVFSELLSSEPGTYTVQVIFPAMALGVAGLVMAGTAGAGAPPRYHMAPWPPLAALFAVALFAGVYAFTGTLPTLAAAVLIAAVAALFYISAAAGRAGDLKRWSVRGIAALAAFAITLLAVVLPSVSGLWPARELHAAIATCPKARVTLLGFNEPSAGFVLGATASRDGVTAVAPVFGEKTPRLTIVEERQLGPLKSEIAARNLISLPPPAACVNVYNVMRGCPLRFKIFDTGAGQRCKFDARYDCATQPPPPSFAPRNCG